MGECNYTWSVDVKGRLVIKNKNMKTGFTERYSANPWHSFGQCLDRSTGTHRKAVNLEKTFSAITVIIIDFYEYEDTKMSEDIVDLLILETLSFSGLPLMEMIGETARVNQEITRRKTVEEFADGLLGLFKGTHRAVPI